MYSGNYDCIASQAIWLGAYGVFNGKNAMFLSHTKGNVLKDIHQTKHRNVDARLFFFQKDEMLQRPTKKISTYRFKDKEFNKTTKGFVTKS